MANPAILQVSQNAEQTDTPPPPLPTARLSLPAQPTILIGRDHELTDVTRMLRSGAARLLSLTGPGGVGKSRLALAIATELAVDFPDGIYFIELAALQRADLVMRTLGEALGLRETTEVLSPARVIAALNGRRVLLVLDNCEHLPAATPDIAHLLAGCPLLHILATSRAPLDLRWEQRYSVPPLSDAAAMQLFIERAHAVNPALVLSAGQYDTARAVCARLDGLPLAIELAAARMHVLSLEQVLAQLAHQPALLAGGPRDLPSRQRSLHATMMWSYDLLTEEQRSVFRQLSVFEGGVTLDGAAFMCGSSGASDILDVLAALVDASLLQRGESVAGGSRFFMLETVREFGLERLREGDDEAAVRLRHLDYLLAVTAEAWPHLISGGRRPWLRRLSEEMPNIRAALEWVLAAGQIDQVLALVNGLAFFWEFSPYALEGRRAFQRALAQAEDRVGTLLYTRALAFLGVLDWLLGDFNGACTRLRSATETLRDLGDVEWLLLASPVYGAALVGADDPQDVEQSLPVAEAAVALARAHGDRWWLALGLTTLVRVALMRGDVEQATRHLDEADALWREVADPWGENLATTNRGMADLSLGRPEQARMHFCWVLARELDDPMGAANTLGLLAITEGALGHLDRSARLSGAMRAAVEAMGGSLPHLEERRFQEHEQRLCEAMGAQAMEAARQAGRHLNFEAAIALALTPLTEPTETEADAPAIAAAAPAAPGALSGREVEVLRLIAAGKNNPEIAEELVISVGTVARHTANIYAKIGARGRADAVAYAIRHDLT